MSVTHVRSGDPPGSVSSGSLDSTICSCACAVCMSGSCCRYNQYPGTVTTTITSGAVLPTECGPTSHDFASVVLPASGTARLFCRSCGVTRKVK